MRTAVAALSSDLAWIVPLTPMPLAMVTVPPRPPIWSALPSTPGIKAVAEDAAVDDQPEAGAGALRRADR